MHKLNFIRSTLGMLDILTCGFLNGFDNCTRMKKGENN